MTSCNICGSTEKKLKEFPPTDEEPDVKPVLCYDCLINPEVQGSEPISLEEKLQMWRDANYVSQ